MKKTAAHVLIVTLLGVAAYSGTFHAPFYFDDFYSITENPLMRDIGNFISRPDGYETYPNRFIGYLSFALNYSAGAKTNTAYHIVNLLIHIINALLVYLLVVMTFRTSRMKSSSLSGSANGIALFVSSVFVVHPVETQAVTYIVQRLASLAALFYLGSLLLYIKARLMQGSKGAPKWAIAAPYSLSLVLAVLAMKTKEIAFTLPVAAVCYEFCFLEGQVRRRLLFLLPLLCTLVIIPLSMFFTPMPYEQFLSDVSKGAPSSTSPPPWDYLMTQFSVIVTYLRLLIFPVNQNLDYDYPVYHSFFAPRVVFSFLLLACLALAAVWFWMRSNKGGDPALRLISYGILWFFLALSVESSVIPIPDVIFEHRVYLPSVGAFIALACGGAMAARRRPSWKRPVVLAGVAIVFVLFAATYSRNALWADEVGFNQDNVAKSPRKARVHNNLGVVYVNRGYPDKGIGEFKAALGLDPSLAEAHYGMGQAYVDKGLPDMAIQEYQISLKLKPEFAKAHINLGTSYLNKGLFDNAIEEYQAALKLDPSSSVAHADLGAAYANKGWIDKGIEQIQIALKIDPANAPALVNLATAYAAKGLVDDAIASYREALNVDPSAANTHVSLGLVLMRKGLKNEAIAELETAARLRPDDQDIRNNLEYAYKEAGKAEGAGR